MIRKRWWLHILGWISVITFSGYGIKALCYGVTVAALLVIAETDWNTFEIPEQWNRLIMIAGIVNLMADVERWHQYIAGFFCISLPLLILLIVSNGTAVGGGDVKLMAAAGLLLGWKKIIVAMVVGCIGASVIHSVRMRFYGEGHCLAFGPYLSLGIWIAMIWGDAICGWYLRYIFMAV